jgi:hypothetical protein
MVTGAHPPRVARAATRLHWVAAGTALLGIVLLVAVIGQALSSVAVRPQRGTVFHVLGYGLTTPDANGPGVVLLALAAVGGAIVLAAARSAIRRERVRRRLLRSLTVTTQLPGVGGALVFEDDRPLAFCTGYLRPRVYLSRGAVQRVSTEQLRAVLAHEEEHRRRRDPLRLACAGVLCDALFFLPLLRALRDRYAALAELLADDAAVAASAGDPSPLAAAMLMFGTSPHEATVGIAPERVDHLLGQPDRWRAPIALALASIAGVVSLALVLWQIGRHALVQTTLNLPVLSSQPCVVVLAALCLAATTVGMCLVRRTWAPMTPGRP